MSQEVLSEILFELHKQLQTLKSKISYDIKSYSGYKKSKFEEIEEDNQVEKKRENGKIFCKYRLYCSSS